MAGTVFTLDGGIVLLKRGVEPALGKWVFPSGYVDRGETVQDAAIRETKEESAARRKARPAAERLFLSALAERDRGLRRRGDRRRADRRRRIHRCRYFHAKELPWQELAFDSTRDALKDYIEKYLRT